MNILSHLASSDKIALIQNGETISYQPLLEKGLGFGQVLTDQQVKSGDKLLIFTPLSIDLYIIMIGAWSIGAVPIFVDFSRGSQFVSQCVETLRPKLVITDWVTSLVSLRYKGLSKVKKLRYKRPTGTGSGFALLPPDHPAIITLTSGTTGTPKQIIRSHAFLIHQYHMLRNHLDFSSDHIDLGTLAVFTLANLASHMTTLLPDKIYRPKTNYKKLAHLAKKHGVTRIIGSPTLAKGLLAETSLPSLKTVYLGGSPVYPSVMNLFPQNINCHVVYGSTEAEPIAHLSFDEIKKLGFHHGLPVGRPVIPCKIGDNHEILVSGDTVIDEGWHGTGDAGFMDDEGMLYLLGKVKHCIQDSHGILFPFQVELALDAHFGIRGAVVSRNGRRVLVIEQTGHDHARILEVLKEVHVEEVQVIDVLPMDKRHHGKIEYDKL